MAIRTKHKLLSLQIISPYLLVIGETEEMDTFFSERELYDP